MITYETFTKRRLSLQSYMNRIPDKHIDLDHYGFGKLILEGFDNLEFCGSVGCLAGWAQTQPEFREWLKKMYPWCKTKDNRIVNYPELLTYPLSDYLGIKYHSGLFVCRENYTVSPKEEIHDRLQALLNGVHDSPDVALLKEARPQETMA